MPSADDSRDDLIALATLNATGLVGSVLCRRLLSTFGSLTNAARASVADLQKVQGIGPITADAISKAYKINAGEKELDDAEKFHSTVFPLTSDAYPKSLRAIFDHPLLLYVRGELKEDDHLSIGVVGSRKATAYGKRQAQRFATRLAELGICVVSGLARGVDAAAHEGAMKPRGGRTIAVLGSGLRRVYPPEHKNLYMKISERGAVISEFPLNQEPLPTNFPRRNRLISGLTLGTLVIEASHKSGALITAEWAMEQNREVFCIPGSIENPMSRGCHALIKQGAKLVEDVEDILTELPAFKPILDKITRAPTISPVERTILRHLTDQPVEEEVLLAKTKLPQTAVVNALQSLEQKQLARRDKNGYLKLEMTEEAPKKPAGSKIELDFGKGPKR